MAHSKELKNSIITRMLPPNNQSLEAIHADSGVPLGTLKKWQGELRANGYAAPTSIPDRQNAITLVNEAQAGASLAPACAILAITTKTFQNWVKTAATGDGRPLAIRPEPANKLSAEERQRVLDLARSDQFKSLPPSQIVPTLADEGASP